MRAMAIAILNHRVCLPINLVPRNALCTKVGVFHRQDSSLVDCVRRVGLAIHRAQDLPLLCVFPCSARQFEQTKCRCLHSIE